MAPTPKPKKKKKKKKLAPFAAGFDFSHARIPIQGSTSPSGGYDMVNTTQNRRQSVRAATFELAAFTPLGRILGPIRKIRQAMTAVPIVHKAITTPKRGTAAKKIVKAVVATSKKVKKAKPVVTAATRQAKVLDAMPAIEKSIYKRRGESTRIKAAASKNVEQGATKIKARREKLKAMSQDDRDRFLRREHVDRLVGKRNVPSPGELAQTEVANRQRSGDAARLRRLAKFGKARAPEKAEQGRKSYQRAFQRRVDPPVKKAPTGISVKKGIAVAAASGAATGVGIALAEKKGKAIRAKKASGGMSPEQQRNFRKKFGGGTEKEVNTKKNWRKFFNKQTGTGVSSALMLTPLGRGHKAAKLGRAVAKAKTGKAIASVAKAGATAKSIARSNQKRSFGKIMKQAASKISSARPASVETPRTIARVEEHIPNKRLAMSSSRTLRRQESRALKSAKKSGIPEVARRTKQKEAEKSFLLNRRSVHGGIIKTQPLGEGTHPDAPEASRKKLARIYERESRKKKSGSFPRASERAIQSLARRGILETGQTPAGLGKIKMPKGTGVSKSTKITKMRMGAEVDRIKAAPGFKKTSPPKSVFADPSFDKASRDQIRKMQKPKPLTWGQRDQLHKAKQDRLSRRWTKLDEDSYQFKKRVRDNAKSAPPLPTKEEARKKYAAALERERKRVLDAGRKYEGQNNVQRSKRWGDSILQTPISSGKGKPKNFRESPTHRVYQPGAEKMTKLRANRLGLGPGPKSPKPPKKTKKKTGGIQPSAPSGLIKKLIQKRGAPQKFGAVTKFSKSTPHRKSTVTEAVSAGLNKPAVPAPPLFNKKQLAAGGGAGAGALVYGAYKRRQRRRRGAGGRR